METEQTQATAIVSTCTSLNLRKAARAASQFLESYLAPLGLHTGQFGILSHVAKAGTITMTRLAESLALDRTTLTRNLQLLQRDGLVEIVSGQDKRVREITLTPLGTDKLAQAIPSGARLKRRSPGVWAGAPADDSLALCGFNSACSKVEVWCRERSRGFAR